MFKNGKISEHDIKSYFTTGLKWLPILSSTMYFKTSEKLINKKIQEVINSKELQEISLELGLIDESLSAIENMTSDETKKQRKKYKERARKIKRSLDI